ncbi:MAG: carboxypeptidase-like regulatory domain-containing protein [Flavobacteriaceae bacterium]|nr:carboxypeptidase-like regulatory domain-containing protein [Flavobacteriaceae bacterium]
MNNYRIAIALAFGFSLATAGVRAQSNSVVLLDSKSKKPVPYATIQYGINEGVIANEEGVFSFDHDQIKEPLDSIYITSMGYEKFGLPFDASLDSVIYIKPKAIKLSGVYLFDNPLTVKEIIEKVQERIPFNYNKEPVRQRFFLRQSSLNTIRKFDVDFKKSTIKELNKDLIDSVIDLVPRNSSYYTETLGDFYRKPAAHKLTIVKAAELYDKSNEDSFEGLGKRMESIFSENIKPDSYLKIKSGIFGTKVQVDSILLDIEEAETDEEAEVVVKTDPDKKHYFLDNRKGVLDDLMSSLFYQEDTKINVINKSRKYRFKIEGYTDINDEGVYVISFEPRGGADYEGTLYVNIENYAVVRLEYKNVKLLRNFRLLGITYQEHLYSGSALFERSLNDTYEIKFIENIIGRKMGVDRPLKVIEKNKNVKGRRKQNELSLGIDIMNYSTEKLEFVSFSSEIIPGTEFENAKENHQIKATYLTRYDPAFWEGHNIMEPNQAIRDFKVLEE